jgi:hypothetical protein
MRLTLIDWMGRIMVNTIGLCVVQEKSLFNNFHEHGDAWQKEKQRRVAESPLKLPFRKQKRITAGRVYL